LTVVEQMQNARRMQDAKRLRDEEMKKKREVTASLVTDIWDQAQEAHDDHPYLARKGVSAHGAKVSGDGRLMLPLMDREGNLHSLQYIAHDGAKMFHTGGAVKGHFYRIGGNGNGTIYICEGFATGASIHRATGCQVVVAYSASNMPEVSKTIRECSGNRSIVMVADHDKSGVGKKYADEAADICGGRSVVIPTEGMDANDYEKAGHDLGAILHVEQTDFLIPISEFCQKPAPVSWLIKGWLQDNSLIMLHGPSGGGKSFTVLDMCLHIASGLPDWFGHKVHSGPVVYLAGEGHHGLKGRISLWMQERGRAGSVPMWVSREGCDLNTPAGYMRVSDNIRGHNVKPRLIVVDTLHRFLDGDENSAQDAKTMIDACGGLMREFGCSVLLVHHTGVSDEAQHRARGSSAWRGALDIEISVTPGKDDQPLKVTQRKAKDSDEAEPMWFDLKGVPINGWLDDDGEPVTSALIFAADEPQAPRKPDSAVSKDIKTFDRAWWASGSEVDDIGRPYLSKSALINFLITNDGVSEASAKQYVKPASGKMITNLLNGEVIQHYEYGWAVICSDFGASLLMRKNNGR
jgi:hypothetical protein